MHEPFVLVIRTLLRCIRDIDGLLTAVISRLFKRSYQVSGSCKKRGICCQNIAIGIHPRLKKIKQWIVKYYEFVYNFQFITYLERDNVLLFRCLYLKNNLCQIHWKRPYICRQYPHHRLFHTPSTMPGCGYHIQAALENSRRSS